RPTRSRLERQRARQLESAQLTDITGGRRALQRKYIKATERSDLDAFVALAYEDVLSTMPPEPVFIERHAAIPGALQEGFGPQSMGDSGGAVRPLRIASLQQPVTCGNAAPPSSVSSAFARCGSKVTRSSRSPLCGQRGPRL